MLVVFWGVFIVLWPLGVPELLSMLRLRRAAVRPIGKVIRTDWPNIVRCALRSNASWSREQLKIYQQADGTQRYVLPLYSQVQEDTLLGTGLCLADLPTPSRLFDTGYVYDDTGDQESPMVAAGELLGGSGTSKLVGFIVEDSEIGQIRFETWDPAACQEGMLVWCRINDTHVF